MLYQLMNKDEVVATYKEQQRLDDYRYIEVSRHGARAHVPFPSARSSWRSGEQPLFYLSGILYFTFLTSSVLLV